MRLAAASTSRSSARGIAGCSASMHLVSVCTVLRQHLRRVARWLVRVTAGGAGGAGSEAVHAHAKDLEALSVQPLQKLRQHLRQGTPTAAAAQCVWLEHTHPHEHLRACAEEPMEPTAQPTALALTA